MILREMGGDLKSWISGKITEIENMQGTHKSTNVYSGMSNYIIRSHGMDGYTIDKGKGSKYDPVPAKKLKELDNQLGVIDYFDKYQAIEFAKVVLTQLWNKKGKT